jgi:8-oxo-dGTP pyrophosphatase MutT (NUDIX family)
MDPGRRLPPGPVSLMPIFTDGRPRTAMRLGEVPGDRPAAVLVLVAPSPDGSAVVILTERATYEGMHSGEVSFPGGKVETGDADLEMTAFREASEEIGLDPIAAGVQLLGRLDPLRIPVSRFSITPVVAIARRSPVLHGSASEVARIIWAPLDAFLPDAPVEIVERQVRDWPLRYGGYRIDGLHVWGATARILGQLGAVVAELEVEA